MEDELEFIAAAVQLIEDFYPTFLSKSNALDGPLARMSFYSLMIESTKISPDYKYREAVVEVLKTKQAKANADLMKLFRPDSQ